MCYSAQYGENFEHVNKSDGERERLNGFNARLRDWYSGKLTLAPIDVPKIKLVLEIGAGSGAWALDAAEALPEAHIIVTDIAPLPDGVRWVQLEIYRSRSKASMSYMPACGQVLMHVKDAPCMLARIVTLLKPGGWLIIEEHDPVERDSEGRLGPMASHLSLLPQQEEMFRQSGRDLGIARHIERILRETGVLDVDARTLDVPFTGYTDDEKLNALGETVGVALLSMVRAGAMSGRPGYTEHLYNEARSAMEDHELKLHGRYYLVWGRKK